MRPDRTERSLLWPFFAADHCCSGGMGRKQWCVLKLILQSTMISPQKWPHKTKAEYLLYYCYTIKHMKCFLQTSTGEKCDFKKIPDLSQIKHIISTTALPISPLHKQGPSPRFLWGCERLPSGTCVNMVKAAEMQIKCHFSASWLRRSLFPCRLLLQNTPSSPSDRDVPMSLRTFLHPHRHSHSLIVPLAPSCPLSGKYHHAARQSSSDI